MRSAEIRSLVEYMYWVNHRLLAAAEGLTADQFIAAAHPTTRDLRATLVHELDVEWSWRLNLQARPLDEFGPEAELQPNDYPTVAALREHWLRDEAEMRTWVSSLSDDDLDAIPPSALSHDRRPLRDYLLHIVVHACQQQADAATLLTLAGRSPGELGYLEFLSSADRSS